MSAPSIPFPDGLHANVRQVLSNFLSRAQQVFGEDLHSAVLFGSAAEGALRKSSDVNLMLVFRRYDLDRAKLIRSDLTTARAAILLRVMFVLEQEIPAACEAFAQKFSDILHRRLVLLGPDPFTGVTIPRAAQVLRLRQVLLNLLLRLRETHAEREAGSRAGLSMIAESTGALRSSAALLLDLESKQTLKPKAALTQLAEQIAPGKFGAALTKLSQLRESGILSAADANELMIAVMDLVDAMHARASGLNE